MSALRNPNAPHNQAFQMKGRPNGKARAWYKRGTNNNPQKKGGN
jgi:hypothetical protein